MGMRIVHVSYARSMDYRDPEAWLKRIDFFVALVTEMAKRAEVRSIHCINHEGVLRKDRAEYHFLKRSLIQVLYPVGLHRYIKRLRPEIVVVHGLIFPWQVLWLRWQLGHTVRIVIQHHAEQPLRHYKRALQKVIDPFVAAYIFTSLDQARAWVAEKQIASLQKVHEIMEVPSVFEPIDRGHALQRTKLKASGMYLWVGRLDANKDPLTLVKAFMRFAATNPNVQLQMVFRGDEMIDDVKRVLAGSPEEAERIKLVGSVQHDELLYWFNSADFILSTSHYEGSGIAVCEAMSCGCIPILTNIPSFRMMTGNGSCGLLFEPGDVDGLFKVLMESVSLNGSGERSKVLEQHKQHLSAEAIAEKMIAVFDGIMKE